MQPIKISEKNHKQLLQLKLDMEAKSVDNVISVLLEIYEKEKNKF